MSRVINVYMYERKCAHMHGCASSYNEYTEPCVMSRAASPTVCKNTGFNGSGSLQGYCCEAVSAMRLFPDFQISVISGVLRVVILRRIRVRPIETARFPSSR